MQIPFMHALIVSICLGALIGLVRQWSEETRKGEIESTAGIRTFSLWSVLGFLAAYLHQEHAAYFFPVAFATFGFILIATNYIASGFQKGFGLTCKSAAILTFLVGSLVFWEQIQSAIAITVSIGVLLISKPFVHRWTTRLTNEDMQSLLQFAVVTGLILPLVPNQGYGPLEAFNPYRIWLMVVLISGLGFVGYVAVRFLGTRAGIIVTGLAGGLASSTATTLALTRNSRDTPEIAKTLAAGIVIANTVMIGRLAVIVLAINRDLFLEVLLPLLVMAIPTCLLLAWKFLIVRSSRDEVELPDLGNPLSLKLAIKFALLYGVVVFLIKAVTAWGDGTGFYPIAFLSGLTDVDAISLSLANEQKSESLSLGSAATGLVLAAIANSIFKTILGTTLGHAKLRMPLLIAMVPMIVAGAAGLGILFT